MTDTELPSIERIELLLQRILDAPESEREKALEQVCEEAPELAPRLRARLSMLARLGLLEDPRRDASEPERIGPYRIVARLGAGGMGIVYLAEHESLGRRVALKCIQPELLASERARERFRREALANGRLQHPGIATLYEAGIEEGRPFLAMQLVEGEPLDAQLRRARAQGSGAWRRDDTTAERTPASGPGSGTQTQRRSRLDAVQLVAELADAVQALHAAGIIHRDLKPANVMVTPAGRPVLIDLGLARSLAEEAAQITQSGDLVGTPAYMAPEQVEPRGRAQDARTDVHALGAILYELLTLRSPFAGESREDTYRRILSEELIDVRRLQPAVSRDLAAVVHKALARDPRRRFATAQELAEELRRVLEGIPTLTRPAGPMRRVWLWTQKRPALAAMLMATFSALGLGLALSQHLLRRAHAAVRTYEALEAARLDPARGLERALEALEAGGGASALSALYAAMAELPLVRTWASTGSFTALAMSPDGELVVGGCHADRTSELGAIVLLRAGERPTWVTSRLGRIRSVHLDMVRGRILAVGSQPWIDLYDLEGRVIRTVAHPLQHDLEELGACDRLDMGVIAGGLQEGMAFAATRDGHVFVCDTNGCIDAESSFRAEPPAGGWLSSDRRPSDGVIALGAKDGTVALYTANGAPIARRLVHSGQVFRVEFSPEGHRLLSAAGSDEHWSTIDRGKPSEDFVPLILDMGLDIIHELAGHRTDITDVEWSPCGDRILTTSQDQTALVWDLREAREGHLPIPIVLAHERMPYRGEFFPDGERILTYCITEEASIWHVSGIRLARLRGHGSGVTAAAITSGGDHLATASLDERVMIWETRSRWREKWIDPGDLASAGIAADGERAWSLERRGRLRVWSRRDNAPRAEHSFTAILEASERITAAAWWPTRDAWVAATNAGRLLSLDIDGRSEILRTPPDSSGRHPIRCLVPRALELLFDADIDRIAVWSAVGERSALPPPTGSEAWIGRVASASWLRDRIAVVMGGPPRLVMFSVSLVGAPEQHPLPNFALSIATNLEDSSATLFLRDGQLARYDGRSVTSLGTPQEDIVHMTLGCASPDGRWLAAACGDRRARIFDREGRLLLTLEPMEGGVRACEFTADGKHLLLASVRGELVLWPLAALEPGADPLVGFPYRGALEFGR